MSWAETLYLSKIIKSSRNLVASDEAIYRVAESFNKILSAGSTRNYFLPKRIKLKTSGSVRFTFDGYKTRSGAASFRIYKNNTLVSETSLPQGIKSLKTDVNVNVGDELSFSLYLNANSYSADGFLENLILCARMVDLSVFSIKDDS